LGAYGQAIVRPSFQPMALQPVPYQPYHLNTYAQPQPQRSSVWDTYRQMFLPPTQPQSPVESAVTGLRHVGEGAAIAALLAFAQRQFGTLDFHGKYPVDGILGALAFALSVKEANKPGGYAADLRAIAQSATTVYTYRKILGDGGIKATAAAVAGDMPSIPRNTPKNDNSDPILAAARAAGF